MDVLETIDVTNVFWTDGTNRIEIIEIILEGSFIQPNAGLGANDGFEKRLIIDDTLLELNGEIFSI